MKNITKHHDEMIEGLSPEIKEKAIKHLKKIITLETAEQIKDDYLKDSDTWWAKEHFGWGMRIRNFLRDNVCLDIVLPSQNWDDYYIPLIEIACGLRKMK